METAVAATPVAEAARSALATVAGAAAAKIELVDVPESVKKGTVLALKGKLTSDAGQGVPAAIVRLMEHDKSFAIDELLAQGGTRDDGSFSLDWKARRTDWWNGTCEIYAEFSEKKTVSHR